MLDKSDQWRPAKCDKEGQHTRMHCAADVLELLHDIKPEEHLQEHNADSVYIPPGGINKRRLVLHILR